MTLPRSSGCTRTSRTLPRRSDRLATWTSSGYWTMPRTRCSRASSSTSGSAGRLAVRGRGVRGLGVFDLGYRSLGVRGLGRRGLGVAGLGVHLARDILGRALLSGAFLGRGFLRRGFLGRGLLGGLGRARGPPGALVFLGFLGGLAVLGGGLEALLLVRLRLSRLQGALGTRLPLELLPVPGDLEQDGDRVRGLRAHRQPVLYPLGVHFDERGLGLRVVLADLLDSAPIALGARVRDNDPVIRLPDLAQALQLDLDSHDCGLLPAIDEMRRTRADRGNSRRDRTDEPGRANEERASLGLAVSITLCQRT